MCAAAAPARWRIADAADIALLPHGAAAVDERMRRAPWIRTGSERTAVAQCVVAVAGPTIVTTCGMHSIFREMPRAKSADPCAIATV